LTMIGDCAGPRIISRVLQRQSVPK
jgi:hypothetical protein